MSGCEGRCLILFSYCLVSCNKVCIQYGVFSHPPVSGNYAKHIGMFSDERVLRRSNHHAPDQVGLSSRYTQPCLFTSFSTSVTIATTLSPTRSRPVNQLRRRSLEGNKEEKADSHRQRRRRERKRGDGGTSISDISIPPIQKRSTIHS